MHDLIFENQRAMKIGDFKGYAGGLGLDMKGFTQCLDGGRYAQEVNKDVEAGRTAGVRGTPSFILGKTTGDGKIKGRLIRGAKPYPFFKMAIEDLLSQR